MSAIPVAVAGAATRFAGTREYSLPPLSRIPPTCGTRHCRSSRSESSAALSPKGAMLLPFAPAVSSSRPSSCSRLADSGSSATSACICSRIAAVRALFTSGVPGGSARARSSSAVTAGGRMDAAAPPRWLHKRSTSCSICDEGVEDSIELHCVRNTACPERILRCSKLCNVNS